MKARKLKGILLNVLGYHELSDANGSHFKLAKDGAQTITWAFHNGRELSPIEVRNVLVKDCKLDMEEARRVANGRKR